MQKTPRFWQTLTVSAALALAVPVFAQSQSHTLDPSDPVATPPSSEGAMKAPQSGKADLQDKAATQADRTLNQRIRQALSNNSTLAAVASTIHLESDNGDVTLHGSVSTDEQKSTIVNMVSQVNGVKKIHDQIKVGV